MSAQGHGDVPIWRPPLTYSGGVTQPREPLSRDHLSEMARGREYEVFDRAIDVQVSRLRKLIEEDPAKPRHLQTVRGFGYVFVPGGEPAAEAGKATGQ